MKHLLGNFTRLLVFLIIVFFTSCTSYKNLPYLTEAGQTSPEVLPTTIHEAKIMPNDIVSITVASTVPGAAVDFNLPLVPTNLGDPVQKTIAPTTGNAGSLQNYIVNKEGKISFPILGDLKIGGMTIKETQDYIVSLIYPRYIVEKPIVNVRFLNFGVSVLGEVNKPGIYNSENGQMTILDALAVAGDMTIYGKRDNVLLVRTLETGETATYRINMQDKNLLANQNIFYLQQNDKLYVETNKAKGNNSSFGSIQALGLSALSIVVSLASVIAVIATR